MNICYRCFLWQDEDLADVAAKQYYVEYGKDMLPERLLNLLPSYLPESQLQGGRVGIEKWAHLVMNCHKKVSYTNICYYYYYLFKLHCKTFHSTRVSCTYASFRGHGVSVFTWSEIWDGVNLESVNTWSEIGESMATVSDVKEAVKSIICRHSSAMYLSLF